MIVILTAIIQILLFVLLGIYSCISRKKYIPYCYESIYLTTRYIMGCNISAEEIKLKNKVLLMSNHPTTLDFIYLLHWVRLNNRLEDIRFISKDSIANIPFLGKYIKESQCLISRDFDSDRDKLIHFCDKLNDLDKYILIIFPEGTTICPETIQKSITFSKNNNKPIFNKVLYPRHRGLELILENLNIQQFLDITLFYNDDRACSKCNYNQDILFDSYPKNGVILTKEIQLSTLKDTSIHSILENSWIEKERFLNRLKVD